QRPVDQPLDGDAKPPVAHHYDGGDEQEDEHDAKREGGAVGHAEEADQGKGQEGAQGEDVPVGEIDELDDAVDHRVSPGDQGEDGAVRNPVDQDLQEKRRTGDGLG